VEQKALSLTHVDRMYWLDPNVDVDTLNEVQALPIIPQPPASTKSRTSTANMRGIAYYHNKSHSPYQ